jgi:ATP-dependent RNA helicase DDX3X
MSKYVPPHLRNRPAPAAPPETAPTDLPPREFPRTRSRPEVLDPSDPFAGRSDIKPRSLRVEEALFGGNKQNTGINFEKYDDIPVEVSGHDSPPAITTFPESNLDPLIKFNINLAGYIVPTPVQKNSISIVIHGRDLMACGA